MRTERERLDMRHDIAELRRLERELHALPVGHELTAAPVVVLMRARGELLLRLRADAAQR
jgi:hypothetical protein